MPMLFVSLNRLFAALRKTLTFQAEQPYFAFKPRSKPHRNATLWGNVVPMPLSSVVGRRSSVVLHPFFPCGGFVGVFSLSRLIAQAKTGRQSASQPSNSTRFRIKVGKVERRETLNNR
jgi:hypothetical protein